jgi:hypothetical protein
MTKHINEAHISSSHLLLTFADSRRTAADDAVDECRRVGGISWYPYERSNDQH